MSILAIDYGDAHTGLAVSDATNTIPGYTTTVHSRRLEPLLEAVSRLAADYAVTEIVLGYPKNMDGTLGERAEKAEALSKVLEERFALPVRLWDERRTTIDAHQILSAAGKNGRKRKKIVDGVAAALILEGYLTFKKEGER